MENVEKRQMAGLFLQQKYDRVDHVNHFWEIKNPGKIQSSESHRILGIIHWFALPAVVSGNEKSRILIETLRCIAPSGLISDHSFYFLTSIPLWIPRNWGRSGRDCSHEQNILTRRVACLSYTWEMRRVVVSDGKDCKIFNIVSYNVVTDLGPATLIK